MGRTSDAKERLVETAAEMFPKYGFHAVGVQQLCNGAGIKPGSFYYFFSSKQELMVYVLEWRWQQTLEYIFQPIENSDLTPVDKINDFFKRLFYIHDSRKMQGLPVLGCTFGVVGSELAVHDEEVINKISYIFDQFVGYFETWLTEAYRNNLLQILEADIPNIARSLLSFSEGLSLMARVQNDANIFISQMSYVNNLIGVKT